VFLPLGEYNNRFSVVFMQKELRYQPSEDELYYAYNIGKTIFVYVNSSTDLEVDISLISLSGNEVWGGKLFGKGYHEFTTSVNNGLYIISLSSKDGYYTKKLMLISR